MHGSTKTIFIDLTMCALTCFHPLSITERFKSIVPNIKEIIIINIALRKTAVNVRASRNGTINQDRADGDACTAKIEPVAHLALIPANICFTAIFDVNFSLFSDFYNEIHHFSELFVTQL